MATRGGAERRWMSTVTRTARSSRWHHPERMPPKRSPTLEYWLSSSPDRRRVLDAALGPQPIDAAADAELRPGAHVAFEHLAVIPDLLDDAHRPVLGQTELLAEIAFDAQETSDLRLI